MGDLQKQQGKKERVSISEVNKILPARMSLEARHGSTCLEFQYLKRQRQEDQEFKVI